MKYMKDIEIYDLWRRLSVRAKCGLLHHNCNTVQEAAKLSESFIKTRMCNVGKVSAEEIISFRKDMAKECYLTVEDQSADEIVISDSVGSAITIYNFEQAKQLCDDLMKLADQKWGGTKDGEEI
jgi:hypothetical protein